MTTWLYEANRPRRAHEYTGGPEDPEADAKNWEEEATELQCKVEDQENEIFYKDNEIRDLETDLHKSESALTVAEGRILGYQKDQELRAQQALRAATIVKEHKALQSYIDHKDGCAVYELRASGRILEDDTQYCSCGLMDILETLGFSEAIDMAIKDK